MKAIVLDLTTSIRDIPEPTPTGDQVLLRILKAGICNTDVELIKGYMGFKGVLGHEFVAEVIDGAPELAGKRVVGEINVACGGCDFCLRGIASQCRNRTTVGIDRHNGAFATHMTLTQKNLHIVPPSVTDAQAIFTEPLAAACQIIEQDVIKPTDRVVLIGAGKLGLLCAQVIKQVNPDLSVIVRRDKQADLLNKWGIHAVRREQLDSSSADVVVDCTGNQGGFADALDIVMPRGTIVLKSTYEGVPQVDLTRIAVDEIAIVGSRCGPFDSALNLLERGVIDVDSMIDATFPLEDGLQAMQYAQEKGVLKVLLDTA